ncbi:MAG: dihydrolipoyl dehydrogenase [Bergeyella sp.]|nr:dihydrolipoyl dehydrogenase [Bergeyella sp.]
MTYDIIVIGSGPGGYVTAIRAAQLGFKTAIIEKENLGGICLNWGCIPTKALLKSAHVFKSLQHAEDYGLNKIENPGFDFSRIIARSRDVANKMSQGIRFLMKKNKIDVIEGTARVKAGNKVLVTAEGKENEYSAQHIIIATGARSRELPNLPQDGKKVIGYRQALSLPEQPKTMIVVGSGAIGIEFADFYHSLGTEVTVVEYLPNILPLEDEEVSKHVEKSLKKSGINILTSSSVESVDTTIGRGVKAKVNTKSGEKVLEADILLSAVGITANIENIGLEDVGIKTENGKIVVNDWYETSVSGYYAIGDVIPTPAFAHMASAEGITCVEKIKGLPIEKIDYGNIPGCTYCHPEVASVGLTEKQARDKGISVRVGKFPFSASGKAMANGDTDGFIKVIFDVKYGEWLGCHMVGDGVTDMISEAVVARKLETTGYEVIKSVHPHPTLSEAIMEAAAAAYGEVIHV